MLSFVTMAFDKSGKQKVRDFRCRQCQTVTQRLFINNHVFGQKNSYLPIIFKCHLKKSVVSCCLCFKICSRSLQLNPFSRIFPFFKNMKYLHRQVKAQLSKYQINKFPRASQSSTNIFIIIFRELIIPDVCSSAYGWLQLPFHINDMCRIQDHERAPRPESSSSPPCGSVEQPIGRIWGCNYHVPA